MTVPIPTPIYRFLHVANLRMYLDRRALHARNDGHTYRTIHNQEIQNQRRFRRIPCGPCGVIHDYVSFYFGPRSPMMLQLHTGRVEAYTEGQEPLVYLVSSAQRIEASGTPFVFSDGHGNAAYTSWHDDSRQLDQVDWGTVKAGYWADTMDDMDRQRRKQAEVLVHKKCDWALIESIAVLNQETLDLVETVLSGFDPTLHRPVNIRRGWYY